MPDHARMLWSGEKMLTTLGIKLKEGRAFYSQFPQIKNAEYILNEAAVKAYRLNKPIGAPFVAEGDTGTIVGIVRDFNFASLHSDIEPMVISYNPYRATYLLVKVKGNQIPETIRFLEKQVTTLTPTAKFTYSFIDETLDKLYLSENRMSQVFSRFAGLIIFISLPLACWAMERWLAGFAYRIVIGWEEFALAGLSALLLALITISFQSVRTALMNPVKT